MGDIQQFPVSASRRPRRLMDRVRSEIRVRHYSIRTEEAYTSWIRRYIQFHHRHPRDLNGTVFLPHALERKYPHADRGVTSPADTLRA